MKKKQRLFVLSLLVTSILIIQTFALASAIYIPPGEDPPTRYRVTGTVRDADTGAYVSGATVKVYTGSTYRGYTTTASNGYFNKYIYSTTPIFFFTVKITKTGYYQKQVTEEVVGKTAYFGTIYMIPEGPPDPPSAPVISNVQTSVNGFDVSISWDMTWGSGATTYETKLWWGEDSVFTGVSPITYTTGVTHYEATNLPVGYATNEYWYKIEALNGNGGGDTPATPVGPSSVLIKHFPTDDTFTYSESCCQTTNYDSDPYWYNRMWVATGDPESPGIFRGWLKFQIPNPEFVQTATLHTYIYSIEPNGHGTITAYSTGTNWEEETITYANSQSIPVISTLSSDTSGSVGSWDSWDITTLAQSSEEISVLLVPSGGLQRGAKFYTREYDNVALRPYLEIEYSDSLRFYDECVNIGSWDPESTFSVFPYSPLAYTDLSSDYTLLSSTGQYYLHENGGGTGSTRGTTYNRPLSQEIPLYNLDSFEVSLNYIYQPDFRQGSIIVALYDSDYISNYRGVMTKPMIVAELFVETESGGTPKMSINAYYVDENLNEQSECLGSQISQSWSGTVKFWYDIDGLWAKLSSGNPVLIASWKEANMRRVVGHVVLQGIGRGSPIPTLSIDNIEVITKSPVNPFIDLRTANELRSGPMDIGLTKPGPTNELQFFPLNGESLEFEMYRTASFYDILLDVRAIPFTSPPPSNPTIEIKINDEFVDNYQVTVDPVQQLPTANFLHESTWTSLTAGYVTIELTVNGWSSADGVVALRGIWVMRDLGASGRFLEDLGQIFPSSGELIYYIPMGPTTNLNIEWEGDDGIEVSVDDHLISWTDQGIANIDLGSYSKGTLHELKLKHTGVLHMQARVNVMHSIYTCLTIEIDYIDFPSTYLSYSGQTLNFPGSGATQGYTDFEVYLTDIWNYISTWFEDHTHGRVSFYIDDAIPYADVQSIETGAGWTGPVATLFGDTWYSHKGSRDYAWALYADNLAGNGGLYIKSNAGVSTENWRDRWVGFEVQWHHYPSATAHELGHLIHVHEGYDSPTGGTFQGQPCEYDSCPMYSGSFVWEYCQFHWFQTWLNTRDQTTGQPSHQPDWPWDWWLV